MRGELLTTRRENSSAHSDLLSLHSLPIYSFEPSMHLDIVRSAVQVAQSLREIGGQQSSDEIFRDWVDVMRNREFAGENLFVDFERVVGEERGIAGEEFEE